MFNKKVCHSSKLGITIIEPKMGILASVGGSREVCFEKMALISFKAMYEIENVATKTKES